MNALDLIRGAENCRLAAYDDKTGMPVAAGGTCIGTLTVGWGDTSAVYPGLRISQDEADRRLAVKAGVAEDDVIAVIGPVAWRGLVQPRQAALVDMAYTMGRFGLAGFRDMLLAVRLCEWQAAHDAALNSEWARDEAPYRASRDAVILLTGEWPESAVP